jgi:hypothetical protein
MSKRQFYSTPVGQAKYIPPEILESEYHIPRGTLANWRCRKVGPAFIKVCGGRRVLYRRSDIEAFLERQLVLTTDSSL